MKRRGFLAFLAALPLFRWLRRPDDVIEAVITAEEIAPSSEMGWYCPSGYSTQWNYVGGVDRLVKVRSA